MDTNAYLAKTFEGLSFENLRALIAQLDIPMAWIAGGIVAIIVAILVITSGLKNVPPGHGPAH